MTPSLRKSPASLGVVIAFVSAVALGTLPARAQPTESTAERAERLFQEAKADLVEERFADAHRKLAESYELDPGTGTLLALALCNEAEGKLATAWRQLNEVMRVSRARGRTDRAAAAMERIDAIEPKLSTLAIRAEGGLLKRHVEVRRDGIMVSPAEWGSPTPLDGGDHVVEAREPGRVTWRTVVSLSNERDHQTVVVPVLEEEASVRSTRRRTIGWFVGGAGVLSVGVGATYGVFALVNHADARDRCPSASCSDYGAVTLNQHAQRQATTADVLIALGVIGLGVGGYLLWWPRDSAPPAKPAEIRASGADGASGGPR